MQNIPGTAQPLHGLEAFLAVLSEMAICTDLNGDIKAANRPWADFFASATTGKPSTNFLDLVASGLVAGKASGMAGLRAAFAAVHDGQLDSVSHSCEHHSSTGWQWLTVKFARMNIDLEILILIRIEEYRAMVSLGGEGMPEVLCRSLLDDLPVLLDICDREMRYTWINRSFRKRFNVMTENVVGKRVNEVPRLGDLACLQPLRQKCFDTGNEQSDIVTLIFNGREMVLDVHYNPVLGENNSVEYVICAHQDITKQVQSQNAKSAAQELLNDVLEKMPIGFVATDSYFHILRANGTACQLFGYTKEDLIGQHVNILIPEYFHENHIKLMEDFAASDATSLTMDSRREIYALRSDGVVFHIMAAVLKTSLGDFPLFCVMIFDLTKIREAEQRLVETELGIQQMQKQEALGQLAGNIAHDFNNLMAIVLGYADMIQSSQDMPDDVREMMAEIKKAVQRGAALTGQILAYAKHQALDTKPVDLHKLLLDNKTMIQAALTVSVKCALNLNAKSHIVEMDENQFMQVIINLAVNARDAMPTGGDFTITTTSIHLDEKYFTARSIQSQPGEYIYMTVADTGTGIPEGAKSRIFDPYFSTKTRDKGTGLGLSVAYGIIKQHRGFIFCDTSPHVGTTFEIFLPVCEQNLYEPAAGPNESQLPDQSERYSKMHILVVDDEEALRKMVVTQLASLGLQVHSAANGREALDFIDGFAGKLDIILTDIMMPEMTGLELADEAQFMQPEATFIFMSGYSKELLMSKKPRDNFRLLTKPFKKETLFAEIHRVLGQKKGGDNA